MFVPDLKKITTRPGVYLMKDKAGSILYVGKAKNLKKRVSSYFAKRNDHSPKTKIMVSKIADLETIAVNNEVESLILENELIKKHRPPFNVMMRDDKSYLYLRITVQDEFPRFLTSRRIARDGAKYFGPYVQSKRVYDLLRLIKKIFPLCSASNQITVAGLASGRKRACLNYHLGICPGVCMGKVTPAEYHETIDRVIDFINGNYDSVLKDLRRQMTELSGKHLYEKAARVRDAIVAVESLSERQRVVLADLRIAYDVIGLARVLNKAVVSIIKIRHGKLLDQEMLSIDSKYETDDIEVLTNFLREYYSMSSDLPKEVLVPAKLPDALIIEKWLAGVAGHKVAISVPSRGTGRKLLDLAAANAKLHFGQIEANWNLEKKGATDGIAQLKTILGVETLTRIEAYDISNTQGTDSVGSMVVFEDGKPVKDQYRRFKIKTVTGPNDFASLAEVLARRFNHDKTDLKFAKNPDLILIDGGKGQVNTVARSLKKFPVKVIGLVKGTPEIRRADGRITRAASHGQNAQDDIVLPFVAKPVELPDNAPAKYLLQNIRDEAHRFAISLHRNLRSKKMRESVLEKIPGVGAETRKKLIKAFGSVRGVASAEEAELIKVVGKGMAAKLRAGL